MKQSTSNQRLWYTMLLITGVGLLSSDTLWVAATGGGLLGWFVYEISP